MIKLAALTSSSLFCTSALSLWFCLGSVSGFLDGFEGLEGLGGQLCDPNTCPSGQFRAPKLDYTIKSNGCGTGMFQIHTDIDFSECCHLHDACYSICGMKKTACEKRFDKCLKARCKEKTRTSEALRQCEQNAKIMILGVQMMGCNSYTESQQEACDCVWTQGQVQAQAKSRLTTFVNTYAPEEDSEELLKKYETEIPLLFLRLLKKYPKAIVLEKREAELDINTFNRAQADAMSPEDHVEL